MSTSAVGAVASRRVIGRLDAIVRHAYDRLGPWYFHGLVLVSFLLVLLVTVPVQNLTQVPFWAGSFDRWWYVWVFVGLAFATGPIGLGAVLLGRHRALVAHLRGRAVDPVAVWRDCVTRLPGSAVQSALLWSVLVVGPGLAYVGRREGFDAVAYVAAYTSQALITFGVAGFYLTLFEVALLPVAREVAPRLPRGFSEQSKVTGRRRLMLLTTAITFTAGCQAAGLSLLSAREGESWIVVLVTIGLVLTYVGLLLSLVTSSVTRRVDELADALKAVAAGDRSVRILPTSGDEFDAVGARFNAMVDLLDSHADDLRSSRARLVAVGDAARRRIERDLHDGAQQRLALLSMQLGQLESACGDRPGTSERVRELRGEVSSVIADMRRFAHGIFPASLEAEGLRSALRAAARESTGSVLLDVADRRWPAEVETAVYFCCWEVLNRVRHAASEPRITVTVEAAGHGGPRLELTVQPAPAAADDAELVMFFDDRLGAVGGTTAASHHDGTLSLLGEVVIR